MTKHRKESVPKGRGDLAGRARRSTHGSSTSQPRLKMDPSPKVLSRSLPRSPDSATHPPFSPFRDAPPSAAAVSSSSPVHRSQRMGSETSSSHSHWSARGEAMDSSESFAQPAKTSSHGSSSRYRRDPSLRSSVGAGTMAVRGSFGVGGSRSGRSSIAAESSASYSLRSSHRSGFGAAGHSNASGSVASSGGGGGQPTASRYLITVVPPERLPHDPPHPRTNPACTGYGPPGSFRRGTLIPLYPTLSSQLGAIAREYGLPSSGGLVVYLLEGSPAVGPLGEQLVNGPRIGDEAWQMLWAGIFEEEATLLKHERLRLAMSAPSPLDDDEYSDGESPVQYRSRPPPVPPIPFHHREFEGSEEGHVEYLAQHVQGGSGISDETEDSISGRSSGNLSMDRGQSVVGAGVGVYGGGSAATSIHSQQAYRPEKRGKQNKGPSVGSRRSESTLHGSSQYAVMPTAAAYDAGPSPLTRSYSSASRHIGIAAGSIRPQSHSRPATSMSRRSAPAYSSRRSIAASQRSFEDPYDVEVPPSRPVGVGAIVGKVEFDIDTRRAAGRWFETWLEGANAASRRSLGVNRTVSPGRWDYEGSGSIAAQSEDSGLAIGARETGMAGTAPLRPGKTQSGGGTPKAPITGAVAKRPRAARRQPASLYLPNLVGAHASPSGYSRPSEATAQSFAHDATLRLALAEVAAAAGASDLSDLELDHKRQSTVRAYDVLADGSGIMASVTPNEKTSATVSPASQALDHESSDNGEGYASGEIDSTLGYTMLPDKDGDGLATNVTDIPSSRDGGDDSDISDYQEQDSVPSAAMGDGTDPLADVFGDDATTWAQLRSEYDVVSELEEGPVSAVGLGIISNSESSLPGGAVGGNDSAVGVERSLLPAQDDVAEVAALVSTPSLRQGLEPARSNLLSSPIHLDSPAQVPTPATLSPVDPLTVPSTSPSLDVVVPPSRTSSMKDASERVVAALPLPTVSTSEALPVSPQIREPAPNRNPEHRLSTQEMQDNLDSLERVLAELSPRALKTSPHARPLGIRAKSMFKRSVSPSPNPGENLPPITHTEASPVQSHPPVRRASVGEQAGYEKRSALEANAPVTPGTPSLAVDPRMISSPAVGLEPSLPPPSGDAVLPPVTGSTPDVTDGSSNLLQSDATRSPPRAPSVTGSASSPMTSAEALSQGDSPASALSSPGSNFAAFKERATKTFARKLSDSSDHDPPPPKSSPVAAFFAGGKSTKSSAGSSSGVFGFWHSKHPSTSRASSDSGRLASAASNHSVASSSRSPAFSPIISMPEFPPSDGANAQSSPAVATIPPPSTAAMSHQRFDSGSTELPYTRTPVDSPTGSPPQNRGRLTAPADERSLASAGAALPLPSLTPSSSRLSGLLQSFEGFDYGEDSPANPPTPQAKHSHNA